MNKKDLSKYFTSSVLGRVPLYKVLTALCCCLLVIVCAGAGIAVMTANAAAAKDGGKPSPSPSMIPSASPTASPTPEPSPTPSPEPIQLTMDVTAVQQTLGVTVKNKETGGPVLNEEFDVVLDYKAPKNVKNSKQPATSNHKIDPKTGTLLLDKLPVGDYTVTITEREGYVMPEPAKVSVKEKVEYKADTEAVKDKIKNESEVGQNDIVSDNKVIQDETSSGFDPTDVTPAPPKNDYDFNDSQKEEIKGTAYLVQNNVQEENGKKYLLNADGSRSNYVVSETAKAADGQEYLVKATLEQPVSAASLAMETASNAARSLLRPFRLDGLLFPYVHAEGESVPAQEETLAPTEVPTQEPTPEATKVPDPTVEPTAEPTEVPPATETPIPTAVPTPEPSATPTPGPTETPAPTEVPLPAELVLFDAAQKAAVPQTGLKLNVSEVVMDYNLSGWQPSTTDKKYYYDPNTHQKVTGTKTIAGQSYKFNDAGELEGGYEPPKPSGKLVKGVDVSKYQRNIDWNAVKASGIDFAIIRVGYRGWGTGALVEDPYFKQNIAGATKAGLKVGLYFYSQAVNEAEAVEEASMVLRLAKGYNIQYPIYFDTEKVANNNGRADGISKAQRTANAVAFCETIQNAGYRAGVYSYASWFYNQLNMASISKYSIWIAQYREQLSFNYNYDIWQYTSKGQVPGIPGGTDMNVSKLG